MLEAWSLGFINWHLPWTNILPMEIGGGGVAACYRNHIKLNPFKARCICIARCAFTYSVAFDVASEGCILPFFIKIVNENEFSCKILSRHFKFKRILRLILRLKSKRN